LGLIGFDWVIPDRCAFQKGIELDFGKFRGAGQSRTIPDNGGRGHRSLAPICRLNIRFGSKGGRLSGSDWFDLV
jgi:hypothetical protein